MTAEGKAASFWTTLPGVLTAVAGLLTAVTGLVVGLAQAGLIGGHDGPGSGEDSSVAPLSPHTSDVATPVSTDGEGDPIAGKWRGRVASPNGDATDFISVLIESPCRLNQPCGTITVKSVPCTGRITLIGVDAGVYEFYVDQFTPDSGTDCSPGGGELFQARNDGRLEYKADYDPHLTGILHAVG
ncbi:hypothetical protein GCM10009798_14340 [Nocardioides panacihumi]|uniref:Uncharacterized protein n=1 Tax=Nocardioides panacihumi TaxID=400774 RepID=A0ABN2QR22_9ACTN